jgi:hypothetical protein
MSKDPSALVAALEDAERAFYGIANLIQDDDYTGPIPGTSGVSVCHRQSYHAAHMEEIRKCAAAVKAALEAWRMP